MTNSIYGEYPPAGHPSWDWVKKGGLWCMCSEVQKGRCAGCIHIRAPTGKYINTVIKYHHPHFNACKHHRPPNASVFICVHRRLFLYFAINKKNMRISGGRMSHKMLHSIPRRLNTIMQSNSNPDPVALPRCEVQKTGGDACTPKCRKDVAPDVPMSARPLGNIFSFIY